MRIVKYDRKVEKTMLCVTMAMELDQGLFKTKRSNGEVVFPRVLKGNGVGLRYENRRISLFV